MTFGGVIVGILIGILLSAAFESIYRKRHKRPVRIYLPLPVITRKGTILPNFEIQDDTVATIPIQVEDSAGVVVPPTSGDTFTAISSTPSLGVSVGADSSGNPTLILTPTVQASPNITVTVSDADGLTAATLVCDIVPDLSPKTVFIDVAGATTAPQPPPSNPGP